MNPNLPLYTAPGRRLRWSPRWPDEEASVLFDGASGDFWVLDHPSRSLVAQVETRPGLTPAELLAGGGWDASSLTEAISALTIAEVLVQGADTTRQIET